MTEQKRTLPDWKNERGVARRCDEILAEFERGSQAFLHYGVSRIAADEFAKFKDAEAAAVEAAKRGDVALLAKLLLDENWQWLHPETRKFMSEIMLGKHQGVGRPKMSPEARWEKTPTHRAAAEFKLLNRELAKSYPGIPRAAVRERALSIATKRTGVLPETLRNYLDRSKKDRRRIRY
jgi:hypothetical protein